MNSLDTVSHMTRRRTSHNKKQFLNMAGEYLVAGELNRRYIVASITFGSSKSADMYAFTPDGGSIARVEVKCTDKTEWVLSEKILSPEKCADN